jgi:hypothetical protein
MMWILALGRKVHERIGTILGRNLRDLISGIYE